MILRGNEPTWTEAKRQLSELQDEDDEDEDEDDEEGDDEGEDDEDEDEDEDDEDNRKNSYLTDNNNNVLEWEVLHVVC